MICKQHCHVRQENENGEKAVSPGQKRVLPRILSRIFSSHEGGGGGAEAVNDGEESNLCTLSLKKNVFIYHTLFFRGKHSFHSKENISFRKQKADSRESYGFHLDFFCLLLLVLDFRANKYPKRTMRCSNGNMYKKPKRAIKGICLFWFSR